MARSNDPHHYHCPGGLLIVDPLEGGHRHIHVSLIFNFLADNFADRLDRVWFYLSDATARIVEASLPSGQGAVFLQRLIRALPGDSRRALVQIAEIVCTYGINHVMFLELDSFLPAIAYWAPKANVSGVWFRPSFHYAASGLSHEGFRQRMTAFYKLFVARVLASRRQMCSILVFDQWAESYSRQVLATEKIRYVPDPMNYPTAPLATVAPRVKGRFVLTIAGEVSKRKGLSSVVAALRLLRRAEQEQVELRIMGRTRRSQRNEIYSEIRRLRVESAVLITHTDEFVSDEALDQVIIGSDLVLLLYQRFIGSSGLLIRAARHNRPVLASKFGLLGALVCQNALGLTVDPYDGLAIANAFRGALNGNGLGFNPISASRFALEHVPDPYLAEIARLLECRVGAAPNGTALAPAKGFDSRSPL